MRQGKAPPDVVCTGRGFHLFRHCADVGPRQGYALVRARSTNIAGLLTSVLFFRSSKISDNETYTYGYDAQEGQYAAWAKFPHLKRLVDEIGARPAAQRAVALKDKHKFKTEMDDEARRAMFRHLHEKVA